MAYTFSRSILSKQDVETGMKDHSTVHSFEMVRRVIKVNKKIQLSDQTDRFNKLREEIQNSNFSSKLSRLLIQQQQIQENIWTSQLETPTKLSDYTIKSIIAAGKYSVCYYVSKKDIRQQFFMKKIRLSRLKTINDFSEVLSELLFLSNNFHPLINNMYEIFYDCKSIFVVKELLLGCDLEYLIENMLTIDREVAYFYMVELEWYSAS